MKTNLSEKWENFIWEQGGTMDFSEYCVNGHKVIVTEGWSTGTELGQHNGYDTMVLVEMDGSDYAGFDVESGENCWDEEFTKEYTEKLSEILEQIKIETSAR